MLILFSFQFQYEALLIQVQIAYLFSLYLNNTMAILIEL